MREIRRSIAAGIVLAVAAGRLSAQVPANRLYVEDQAVTAGGKAFVVPVRIDTDQARHGVALGIRYDPAVLRLVLDGGDRPRVDLAGTVCQGAEWRDGKAFPEEGRLRWSLIMGLDAASGKIIPAATGQVLLNLSFAAVSPGTTRIVIEDGAAGGPGSWTTVLATRGAPPTRPALSSATITIAPEPTDRSFLRGDANGDHAADLSDVVSILGFLFQGAGELPCRAAADVNADERLDLSDGIRLLFHLFVGSSTLPAPFPACDRAPASACAEETCTGP
jgi:hypothetical protein